MLEASGQTLVTMDGQSVRNCVIELTDNAKQLEREVMKVCSLFRVDWEFRLHQIPYLCVVSMVISS